MRWHCTWRPWRSRSVHQAPWRAVKSLAGWCRGSDSSPLSQSSWTSCRRPSDRSTSPYLTSWQYLRITIHSQKHSQSANLRHAIEFSSTHSPKLHLWSISLWPDHSSLTFIDLWNSQFCCHNHNYRNICKNWISYTLISVATLRQYWTDLFARKTIFWHFVQDHSKSNRLLPGLCATIPQNFVKIWSAVFSNIIVNKRTNRQWDAGETHRLTYYFSRLGRVFKVKHRKENPWELLR